MQAVLISLIAILATGVASDVQAQQCNDAARADGGALGRGVHINQIEGVAFSADNNLLATADNGGRLAIWDVAHPRLLRVLSGRN